MSRSQTYMMTSASRPLLALVGILLALCLCPRQARAQSDADRAAAQALFEEAQTLKDQGDMEKACVKFKGSQALDPAVGTQLNLADCYEQIGKTASAWVNFIEVAESKDAGERRAKFAQKRADAIKPKLTKLRISVATPVTGMTVKRNGITLAEPAWGSLMPVDPGSYEIVATAPDKLAWRDTVTVEGEGEQIEVEIPSLEAAPIVDDDDDPSPLGPDTPKPEPDVPAGNGQLVAGGIIGGLGVVGIGIGAVFAGIAHSKHSESKDRCQPDDPDQCDAEGVAIRQDAQTAQTVYVVSFAVGGAALVAGLVTFLTAPSSSDGGADAAALQIAPLAGPRSGGLQISGRF